MKKLAAIVLALAGAGCAEVERHEFDVARDKLDKLELNVKNDKELQVHLYNELVQNTKGLGDRVTQLDSLVRTMQVTLQTLENRVKILESRPVVSGPDVPAPPPLKPEKPEEIDLHITTTLGELRTGKMKAEEALALLKPYSARATPKVLDELAGAVTKFDYAKQLESILGRFPPADLRGSIQKALVQRGLRESAARIVGQTRDLELGKILEAHADSNDEDFRLVVGESLVQCKNARGIPILVIILRNGEMTTRTIAIAALKKLNRGEDFGYRAQFTNEQNAAAVKAWEDWTEKFGKKLFD